MRRESIGQDMLLGSQQKHRAIGNDLRETIPPNKPSSRGIKFYADCHPQVVQETSSAPRREGALSVDASNIHIFSIIKLNAKLSIPGTSRGLTGYSRTSR